MAAQLPMTTLYRPAGLPVFLPPSLTHWAAHRPAWLVSSDIVVHMVYNEQAVSWYGFFCRFYLPWLHVRVLSSNLIYGVNPSRQRTNCSSYSSKKSNSLVAAAASSLISCAAFPPGTAACTIHVTLSSYSSTR